MIPIRSTAGAVIGFGGRALSDEYASTGSSGYGQTEGPSGGSAGGTNTGSGSSASSTKARGNSLLFFLNLLSFTYFTFFVCLMFSLRFARESSGECFAYLL